jgi:hypothetical protein
MDKYIKYSSKNKELKKKNGGSILGDMSDDFPVELIAPEFGLPIVPMFSSIVRGPIVVDGFAPVGFSPVQMGQVPVNIIEGPIENFPIIVDDFVSVMPFIGNPVAPVIVEPVLIEDVLVDEFGVPLFRGNLRPNFRIPEFEESEIGKQVIALEIVSPNVHIYGFNGTGDLRNMHVAIVDSLNGCNLSRDFMNKLAKYVDDNAKCDIKLENTIDNNGSVFVHGDLAKLRKNVFNLLSTELSSNGFGRCIYLKSHNDTTRLTVVGQQNNETIRKAQATISELNNRGNCTVRLVFA